MEWLDIDWTTIVFNLALMAVAYLLALPVGLNRERYDRSAGLRTFPLVAVATCGFMLVGIAVMPSGDAQARVMQGIITGMGFIGGGAILKNDGTVTGMATAASLWGTGAVGTAVAWHRFEIAIIISAMTWLTLRFATPLKEHVPDEKKPEG